VYIPQKGEKVTFLEFVHGLARNDGAAPVEPYWISVREAQRAIDGRDSALAEEILASMCEPTSEIERYAFHLLKLSTAISSGDTHTALKRCTELELLPFCREPLAQALADHRIGIVLRMSGRYDDAVARQLSARAKFDVDGRSLESALCMAEVAATLLSRGDVAGATASYLSSLSVIEREATESKCAMVKANLASALQRSGNASEAERLYLQSLEVHPFTTLSPERAMLLQNLALIAKLDGRYATASDRYTDALACLEGKGLYGQRARLMSGLADLALRTKEFDTVRKYIGAIGEINEGNIPVDVQVSAAATAARLAALEGDLANAMVLLNRARTIARDAGLLTERYEMLTEALTYIDDPANKLDLLDELVEVQNERLKAVPSSVSSIIDLRSKYEQEKAALELERQQERTRVIIDTQTRMLEEIGRDLHDSVGQDLTVLNMLVNQLDEATTHDTDHNQNLTSTIEKLKLVSTRVYSDTRRLSHLLSGAGITGPGLEAALHDLGRDIMSANSSCTVETLVTGDLHAIDDAVARTLYRLFQSLTQNVLRHANATTCILQLLVRPDAIVASVEDNGIGYDQHTVEKGLGTRELFARAEVAGGTARIDTAPGHGTFVEITIQRRYQ